MPIVSHLPLATVPILPVAEISFGRTYCGSPCVVADPQWVIISCLLGIFPEFSIREAVPHFFTKFTSPVITVTPGSHINEFILTALLR